MTSAEDKSTPELIAAQEAYRTSLKAGFRQFGISAIVLDEIVQSGCTPTLEYICPPKDISFPYPPRRQSILPKNLNSFFFEALDEDPHDADAVVVENARLTLDDLEFNISFVRHIVYWSGTHMETKTEKIVRDSWINFNLTNGSYSRPRNNYGQTKFSIKPGIAQQLTSYAEIIAKQTNTVVSIFKPREK